MLGGRRGNSGRRSLREELAKLSVGERLVVRLWVCFAIVLLPVAGLIIGLGPTTVGVVLLLLAMLVGMIPVPRIMQGRLRRRRKAAAPRKQPR